MRRLTRCTTPRRDSATPGFTKRTGVSVGTQFGTYTVDVVVPIALLLPASKGLSGFVPPIDGEHFQCYKLANVKGLHRRVSM